MVENVHFAMGMKTQWSGGELPRGTFYAITKMGLEGIRRKAFLGTAESSGKTFKNRA